MTKINETEIDEISNYGFYSKKLNKPFDTLEELKEAEAAVIKAEEEKKAIAAKRKAEADVVNDAFKALNAAKNDYNKAEAIAQKEYSQEVLAAKEKYLAAVEENRKVLDAAQSDYNKALDDFNKAHPDGFHLTLRDGDYTNDISVTSINKEFARMNELFKSVWSLF